MRSRKPAYTIHGVLLLCALAATVAGLTAADWVSLFDGKTLNGWVIKGPPAKVEVLDGELVVTPVVNENPPGGRPQGIGPASTYLVSAKEYGDFDLQFEVKMEPGANSGVQFRSTVAGPDTRVIVSSRTGGEREEQFPEGGVFGYQFEIVGSQSGNTGNVFDEGRRMRLLVDLKDKPEAKAAFKDNEWNHCRLECRGDRIRTWVNGIPVVDFQDAASLRGILGIQIHAMRRGEPKSVRFRNLRIQELN